MTGHDGRTLAPDRERELRSLRILFEQMTSGCILIEPDLTIGDWNPSAERIFGWRRAEALGRDAVALLASPGPRSALSDSLRELLAGSDSQVRVHENVTKDARRLRCEWHVAPLRDEAGTVLGLLSIVRDVSDRTEADEELQASRARLVRILDGLPVATAIARADGSVESFNRRAVELFGPEATAAPTLRSLVRGLLPEGEERRTLERTLERLQSAAAAGVPEQPLLLAGQVRDGRKMVVAANCVVVDDLIVWTASDLTDILRLEGERARLGRIVEESIDEVYVFDASTLRFRSANRSARENVGYSLEELGSLTPLDLKTSFTPESFERLVTPLRDGLVRGIRFETHHRRRDGSTYPVEVHLQLSAEGGDPVFVAIIQDISDRRRAEAKIRALNAELEERVRARTAELEEANRELEAFAYSVSHDLRTPLRAMDGFSQLLLEEYGSSLDAEGRRYLGRVRAGSQKMGRLVDDLLRLSRIGRVEFRREDVSLSALAAEIGAELGSADPERPVVLSVEPGMMVRADRSLLRILLENLLRNAFKFTGPNGAGSVTVGREERGTEPVYFVRDDGAGFDMKFADQLFKPFSRLHAPGEFEGTGIGLAIVDRIVRRHGGRISGEGEPGKGATFRFTLGAEGTAP